MYVAPSLCGAGIVRLELARGHDGGLCDRVSRRRCRTRRSSRTTCRRSRRSSRPSAPSPGSSLADSRMQTSSLKAVSPLLLSPTPPSPVLISLRPPQSHHHVPRLSPRRHHRQRPHLPSPRPHLSSHALYHRLPTEAFPLQGTCPSSPAHKIHRTALRNGPAPQGLLQD